MNEREDLGEGIELPPYNLAVPPSDSTIPQRWLGGTLGNPENSYKILAIVAPIGLGIALGLILLFARGLSSEWYGLIVLATVAPTIVLLVNDVRRLLLITLVVDIPLGLDIALQDHPEHTGGPSGFVISLMTMALVVGYAVWATNRPVRGVQRVRTHKDITIPALAYLFFSLLSSFQSQEVWFSVYGMFLLLQFFLMYLYLSNHIKTWSEVRLIMTTLVICVIAESVLMLLQYYAGFELSALGIVSRTGTSNIESASARVGGTLGPANAAATYLATSLAITFAIYVTGNWLVNKNLTLVALLVGMAALIMTQSRSGWAAFAAALLIIVVQATRRHLGTKALWLLSIVIAVLGIGFSTIIIDRYTKSNETSALSRSWYAEMALNVINDHMFAGIGLNQQRFIMDDFDYIPLELIGRNRTLIHNKYLSMWMEIGLFGFLSFVLVLFATGKRAVQSLIRAKDARVSIIMTGLLAALVAYSMHMFTATFTARARIQTLWFIMALIAAISRLASNTDSQDAVPRLETAETALALRSKTRLPTESQRPEEAR